MNAAARRLADNPAVPLTTSLPTEAEIRAGDLEQDPEPANIDDSVDASSDEDAREDRLQRIRQAAYTAAERRGFEPGHELEDWLEAEATVGSLPRG